jgi:class 3 adenylate cyclase
LHAAWERRGARTKVRRTFMFTDIEGSTRLAEQLGDVAWAQRLRWRDETVRGLVTRWGGDVVKSTGDGFFVAFSDAASAVSAAMDLQRAFRDAGPADALAIRIGLHATEAHQTGADYTGLGVHVAARVGALASGGEILATRDVTAEAAGVVTSDEREVSVRGVSTPVRVAVVHVT